MDSDALRVCMTHSLSTECEEVMGLLIGEVSGDTSHIYGVILLKRSDKRKDRVEISPEQLSNASTEAEKVGLQTRAAKPLRIVGGFRISYCIDSFDSNRLFFRPESDSIPLGFQSNSLIFFIVYSY